MLTSGNNPLSFTDALGLAIDECGDDEDCIQKCLDEYYGEPDRYGVGCQSV